MGVCRYVTIKENNTTQNTRNLGDSSIQIYPMALVKIWCHVELVMQLEWKLMTSVLCILLSSLNVSDCGSIQGTVFLLPYQMPFSSYRFFNYTHISRFLYLLRVVICVKGCYPLTWREDKWGENPESYPYRFILHFGIEDVKNNIPPCSLCTRTKILMLWSHTIIVFGIFLSLVVWLPEMSGVKKRRHD